MIQFFINNIEIVLPEDAEVETVEENPLITRNGEFSMDITTSLLEGKNARAFKHINRLNQSIVQMEGDARMLLNGRVRNGKYTVLKVTNTNVTWQFISGNSEIIYVTSDSKKIWELDFGTETEITYERALASITNPSYTNKFVCVPVKFSNCISNDYEVEDWSRNRNGIIIGVKNIVMHPYLLYYVNKLPELLGFTLNTNVLNSDPRAQMEFIANRVQSLNYSDALPDITVEEFISAIEYGFNVVFNFNSTTKTLDIINTKSHISGKKIVALKTAIDDFEKEPSKTVYRFSIDKLNYEIENTGFMKYLKLSDDIIKKSTFSTFSNTTELINSLSEADKNKFKIYVTSNNNRQYVFCSEPEVSVYSRIVPATTGFLVHVNKLRANTENGENEFTSKISPLTYVYAEKLYTFREYQGGDYDYNAAYQLPEINSQIESVDSQNIIQSIETSVKKIQRADKIEVGLYNGLISPLGEGSEPGGISGYPISFIDTLPEFWLPKLSLGRPGLPLAAAYFNEWVMNVYQIVATQTLRIIGSDGVFENYYQDNLKFDTNFIYTSKTVDNNDLSIDNLFEHQNNVYIPIKFERKNKRNKTLVTVYFYRMK